MAHIHEKIDFTATVLVVCGDKVLLRKHEKYGIWIGVGGHIELDEDANAAALREVKEEVGLAVTLVPPPHWESRVFHSDVYKELVPPLFMNMHQINDVHQHHDLIFVAKSETFEVIPENENDEWRWCTKEDLDTFEGLEPRTRHYALYALELAGS